MPASVLIAPDKFKGTLTAPQAAKAIANGWRAARPQDEIVEQPISDGGDGFGSLLAAALGAEKIAVQTVNAAGQAITACFWKASNGGVLVESANIIGLAMLTDDQRQPMAIDSTGLGIALQQLSKSEAKEIIVGIGGSATNDGGFGAARALGWIFLDEQSREIKRWTELSQLTKIVRPQNSFPIPITVAVDVQNSLLGSQGCSRIFGPQKGLRESDLPQAEAALARMAEIWTNQSGENTATIPGAGAAGGLGYGLHCFAGATIRPGFDLYTEATGLHKMLSHADWMITGEGSMDRQTTMGKGVGELALLARQNNCRTIALAGMIGDRETLQPHFDQIRALTEITSPSKAKENAAQWLEELAHQTAQAITGD